MVSTVIYILLEIQPRWLLQVNALIIFTLNLPEKMMQKLSSQLLQLSAWDRKLFVNAVEELDTKMIHASCVVQNSSRQVLVERWINSMHYMVTNQNNQQENGTANLRQLTSNPIPLLPEPTLWFQLSWGNWIVMPLIMVILLQKFQLSLVSILPAFSN